jgi:hypothetical protein
MSATSTTISSTNTVTRWHEFQTVRRNITRSTAAYSLVGFFLQIKDRHYGNTWSKAIRASHYSHRFWHHVWSSPGGNLGDPRPSFMKFFYFSPFLKVAFPIHFQISISHQDSSRTCIARSIFVSLVWLILDTRQPRLREETLMFL